MSFKIIGRASENSVDAFREVLSQGADGIALRLARSKEGELVIQNKDRPDFEHRVKPDWRSLLRPPEEETPTLLTEILDLIAENNPAYKARTGHDLIIDIEMTETEIAADLQATIQGYTGRLNNSAFLFNSSDKGALRKMHDMDPGANLVLNTKHDPHPYYLYALHLPLFQTNPDYHAINYPLGQITPELIDTCRQNKTGLCATMYGAMTYADMLVLKTIHDHADQLPRVFVKTGQVKTALQARNFLMSNSDMTSGEEPEMDKDNPFRKVVQEPEPRHRNPWFDLDMDK